MAGFLNFDAEKTNYKSENKPLPEGTYEMVINSVEVRASKGSNHEYLSFDFIVRKDLDKVSELKNTNAKQHGRHLFASVYTLKDDDGNDSGKYDPRVLKHILKVAGVKSQQIDSITDYMNILFNKPIRVSVSIRENEYKGKKTKQNSATSIYFDVPPEKDPDETAIPKYIGWYKTKYPFQKGVAEKLAENNPATAGGQDPFPTDNQTISDDDLPF